MTATTIKPCPFCRNTKPVTDEIDKGIWAVCCNECMTIGPNQDGEQSPEEAIRKWNERK